MRVRARGTAVGMLRGMLGEYGVAAENLYMVSGVAMCVRRRQRKQSRARWIYVSLNLSATMYTQWAQKHIVLHLHTVTCIHTPYKQPYAHRIRITRVHRDVRATRRQYGW